MLEIILLFVFGAFGALIKDIFQDNCLILPKVNDGTISLGFLGSLCIGAFIGYLVDNDPVTAFLGGYAGYQILESFTKDKTEK